MHLIYMCFMTFRKHLSQDYIGEWRLQATQTHIHREMKADFMDPHGAP